MTVPRWEGRPDGWLARRHSCHLFLNCIPPAANCSCFCDLPKTVMVLPRCSQRAMAVPDLLAKNANSPRTQRPPGHGSSGWNVRCGNVPCLTTSATACSRSSTLRSTHPSIWMGVSIKLMPETRAQFQVQLASAGDIHTGRYTRKSRLAQSLKRSWSQAAPWLFETRPSEKSGHRCGTRAKRLRHLPAESRS